MSFLDILYYIMIQPKMKNKHHVKKSDNVVLFFPISEPGEMN